jgi:hypothetical protein
MAQCTYGLACRCLLVLAGSLGRYEKSVFRQALNSLKSQVSGNKTSDADIGSGQRDWAIEDTGSDSGLAEVASGTSHSPSRSSVPSITAETQENPS